MKTIVTTLLFAAVTVVGLMAGLPPRATAIATAKTDCCGDPPPVCPPICSGGAMAQK